MGGAHWRIYGVEETVRVIIPVKESVMQTTMACLIYISEGGLELTRPKGGDVYVMHWKEGDMVIPWPEGMTAKEAILAWAKEQ